MSGLTSGLQRLSKAKTKNKADEIFAYLHKVRMEDDPEFSELSEEDDSTYGLPGEKSMAGMLFREDKPVVRRIPDKPNITFTSMMPKKSSGDNRSILQRLGSIKFSDVDDTIRDVTDSPLVRAGALGLLGGGAMYMLYPKLDKPDPTYSQLYGGDKAFDTRRKWVSGLTGLGLTALGVYASSHPDIASSWYRYTPKKDATPKAGITKISSMFGPAATVPLGFAQHAVMASPTMTAENKYKAMNMLNAIPGGAKTPITSTDIVSTAVATGASAGGYPIGRSTVGAVADALIAYTGAKAFGAKDPSGLATKVGLGSLGLRLVGQLF